MLKSIFRPSGEMMVAASKAFALTVSTKHECKITIANPQWNNIHTRSMKHKCCPRPKQCRPIARLVGTCFFQHRYNAISRSPISVATHIRDPTKYLIRVNYTVTLLISVTGTQVSLFVYAGQTKNYPTHRTSRVNEIHTNTNVWK